MNEAAMPTSLQVAEIEGDLVSIRVTVLGFTFESTVGHFLQLGRDRGIDFARRNRLFQKAVVRALSLKGRFARQHFVQHHAEGVDVAAGIVAFSVQLFRRSVFRYSHDLGQIR